MITANDVRKKLKGAHPNIDSIIKNIVVPEFMRSCEYTIFIKEDDIMHEHTMSKDYFIEQMSMRGFGITYKFAKLPFKEPCFEISIPPGNE